MRPKRDQSKHKASASSHGAGGASQASAGGQRRNVRFVLGAPEAREVFIAGSFDEWKATGLPMKRADDGTWVKDLSLEPGIYEYLFVVDGVWTPDPAALASIPNPYGGVNSCVTVT